MYDASYVFIKLVSFIPILIIIIGVLGNSASFLIFRFHKDINGISSMVYLSFIAITDTLSLFLWNLDHFTEINFHLSIENFSIVSCRIGVFIQYTSLQSSAFLLSMVCIDRYIFIKSLPNSFLSRLPFRTARSATIWSLVIIGVIGTINSHILLFAGVYEIKVFQNLTEMRQEKYFVCYKYENGFSLSKVWETVHLFIYNLIPFAIMIVFNILIIKNIIISSIGKSLKSYSKSLKKRGESPFLCYF